MKLLEEEAGKAPETVADKIASGPSSDPMILPPTTIVKSAPGVTYTALTPPGISTPLNSALADEDEDEIEDTDGFVLDDQVLTSNFSGKKPKKPRASLAKLPAQKERPTKLETRLVKDHNGNEYEFLGQFDGKLDFLTEKYSNVAPPPPGSFLYRRETGVYFDGKTEYEYFIGGDPETSDLFGINFKSIGKALKNGISKAKSFLKTNLPKIKSAAAKVAAMRAARLQALREQEETDYTGTVIESDGKHYEYVGEFDGDLSFLSEIEPGLARIPKGSFLYRVYVGNSFDGDEEYEYFIGAHPAISNGLGSFFKKIGKGIGKAFKAVGKGVKNAAKWTGKTVKKGVKAVGKGIGKFGKFAGKVALSAIGADPNLLGGGAQATPEQSNGVSNPLYGMGGSSGDIFGASGYDEDLGAYDDGGQGGAEVRGSGTGTDDDTAGGTPPPEATGTNKILIYVAIGLVVGALVYLIIKKK